MNFYKHHIGDYEAATSHLSLIEDAIYARAIRRYYLQEGPLPVEPERVARLIRASNEVETVKAILIEFFYLADDGWHHKRCDEEIAAASAQAETNRRIAQEREARKRGTKAARVEHEPSDEALHAERMAADLGREPSQTPDARRQTSTPEGSTPTPAAAPLVGVFEGHERPRSTPNPAAAYAIALTDIGVQVTSMNPELIAAVEEGVTLGHLVEVAKLNPGKPIKYLTSQARREHAERAAPITPGVPRGTTQNLSAIERSAVAYVDITDPIGAHADERNDPRLVG